MTPRFHENETPDLAPLRGAELLLVQVLNALVLTALILVWPVLAVFNSLRGPAPVTISVAQGSLPKLAGAQSSAVSDLRLAA